MNTNAIAEVKPSTAKVERPQLGEWCQLIAEARRTYRSPRYWYPRYLSWERNEISLTSALFIGWRTMPYGRIESISEDEGNYFVAAGYVEVWMFMTDPRRKPIYAFPADVSITDGSAP